MNGSRRDLLKAIAGAAAATFLGGLQLTGRKPRWIAGVKGSRYVVGVDHGVPDGDLAYTLMEKRTDGSWHVVGGACSPPR